MAIRQLKYLVVAIEYFTKWIEVEPVAQIMAHKIQHFVWKNIVCRFGQWHPIRKPIARKAVYKNRDKAGVRISQAPLDEWVSRVFQPSPAQRSEEKA